MKYLSRYNNSQTDEHGRTPLFWLQTPLQTARIQGDQPLHAAVQLLWELPHGRPIDACEAYVHIDKAMTCPPKSLHPIRHGSITHHLKHGVPKEALAEWVDVSVDVLEKHYDVRTHEDKREGRWRYLDLL